MSTISIICEEEYRPQKRVNAHTFVFFYEIKLTRPTTEPLFLPKLDFEMQLEQSYVPKSNN